MWYNGNIILCGKKDPSTDLWTLPINADIEEGTQSIDKPTNAMLDLQVRMVRSELHTRWCDQNRTKSKHASRIGHSLVCPPPKKRTTMPSDAHDGIAHMASFTNSIKTRANGVKFAHQSLCNPKILTLLKAVRRGFLDGCPNLSEKLINKYLNTSPATTKGHMKRP